MERLTISKAVLSISKVVIPIICTFIIWVGALSFAFVEQFELDVEKATVFFLIACYFAYSYGYKEWYVETNRKLLFILIQGLPVTLALLFGISNFVGI
ncbi:hypothetical protein S4054249_13245 [Pseudoalteromonas luteoviolacea]|uniref:Uncharacterized protein n=1 Tax=Pseudoalteromonas luteoviolacea S4054 TaxID=1129367 RepID=A0A0F6A9U5_9GAMM|nr:hypothetical protein S4054249_13245 [Pseudoalteromonas luteoviolacea]AOT13673.1 hypothetical protein S40542_13215 [Pseudoalteromonas luteoviolacea]AOT18587.1 hypothetical protein S4054_13220 [Pseudoalteromonas luteoviolacea]KKE82903.1 hypothetical protein N479_15955 [Pseudoalteromonas luteoviolacea S4054]KZN72733.1 hypothetical protein N481_01035 [Pseudoalteromonas luteoviolacea S4047-1]